MEIKIAFLIIVVSVSNLLATETYSQVAKVSLDMENRSLEQVMDEIERQSEFYFIFNQKQIDVHRMVDIQANGKLITDILPELFKGTNVQYAVFDRKILLTTEPFSNSPPVFVTGTELQQQIITGTVTDASTGDPMPGVNIVIKGTALGALTDVSGNYTLSVSDPQSAVLVFSFIGYRTQEVNANGRSIVNIQLIEEIKGLDEVVVIGYGIQRRADLTGSVGSVNISEIQDLSVTRVEQALLGKMAGVQVKAVSGEPGVGTQIRIRGIGSISASVDPLYVVDGFPTDDISTISPNDIESIDVLKDASATAIYGSRGSNGVIFITTKRGTIGRATFNFDTHYGVQTALRLPEYMNAMEQAQYYYDGLKNRNLDWGRDVSGDPLKWHYVVPNTVMDVLEGRNTIDRDRYSDVLQTAPITQYQLTASGGDTNLKYAMSGEYVNQDGIVVGSSFKRYSLRSNIDAQLSKKLEVKVNLNPSFTDSKIVNTVGENVNYNEGVIGQANMAQPYYPLFNEDGTYFIFKQGMDAGPTGFNPVALTREITNNEQAIRLLGNLNAIYSITENLNLSVLIGTSLQSSKNMYFRPNLPVFLNQLATGRDGASMRYNWLTEYTLNYIKSFGKHNLVGLIGFTAQKDKIKSNFMASTAYPNNLVPTLSATSGIITNGTSYVNEWALVSYLGRINYNYDSRYYLTASMRTDGSSRFGQENKFGYFPSFALAWRISEENFLNASFISELKLRLSYGETGNNNIGNYDQYATINYVKYPIGNLVNSGFTPANLANPGLTWEKQRQLNSGIDFGFFNNRVVLNVDYFISKNIDLLLDVNIPDITGFSTSTQNLGEVMNTGWEFMLNTRNFTGDFNWTTNFNISFYRNEVLSLGPAGDPIYRGGNVTMIGQPIGMFYGWLTDGIFLNQAEVDQGPVFSPGSASRSRPGDTRFVDVSGPDGVPDGIIDLLDKTIMGSPYPDFYYGMTNTFSFKNLSLNISLQGSQGNDVLFATGSGATSTRGRIPALKYLLNYWKSEEDPGDGKTVRPNDSPTGNVRGTYSQRRLWDGSYLRINSITLNYVIPDKISQKLGINSTKVYINAINPFLFTKYPNFNPDVSNSGDPLTPGNDSNNYPIPKSFVMGVNIAF